MARKPPPELWLKDLSRLRPVIMPEGPIAQCTYLVLAEKSLTYFHKAITMLTNLHELYLYQDQLIEVPKEISQLGLLTQLNLSYNRISNLPDEFSALVNLRGLDLSCNHVTQLPQPISALTTLTKLHVGGNPMEWLPVWFTVLSEMKELDITFRGDVSIKFAPHKITAMPFWENTGYASCSHIRNLTLCTPFDEMDA